MNRQGKYGFKPGDIIVICVLLVLGAGTWIGSRLLAGYKKAESVRVVSIDGETILPLKDTTLAVNGPLGTTLVKIEKSKVRVTEACCPRQICLHQGNISRPGESIVCLPNRIVITLQGRTTTDAVTY